MPKYLQKQKSQLQYDSDDMSDQNSQIDKVKHYEPLGLTPQQLQSRLHSLVNFSTYQKTKNQRFNITNLTQIEQAPIVSTLLNYGAKEGKNQVLPDYTGTQKANDQQDKANKFAALLNCCPQKRKRKAQNSDPSFIRYKTIEDQQKTKVYKMINSMHLKNNSNKQRYITQMSTSLVQSRQKIVVAVPKQLKKLKNRLSLLPILRKHSNLPSEESDNKPLELDQNKTLSINDSQTNAVVMLAENIQNAYKNQSNIKIRNNFSKRYGRDQYLKEMKVILDKTKNDTDQVSYQESLLRSSYLVKGDYSPKKSIKMLVSKKKSRKVQYWPNYSQYCIPKKEQIKIQRMKEKFYSFNPERADIPPQVRELQETIKQQISSQQMKINHDLIAVERNLLGHKFDYIFELQRQNYKRNVKELIKCKKQYFIEKRREQIRANGIKRMKTVVISGHHKSPPKKKQQDNFEL